MTIFYHLETETWSQNSLEPRTFGGLKRYIGNGESESNIPFKLQLKGQHIGPLIGIMTARKYNSSLAINRSLFIDIQNELVKRNALSFIFSYEDVTEEDWITGYIYLPLHEEWLQAKMPFPDIVYNRVPFRKAEKSAAYQECIRRFQVEQIPFFNPGFIDKFDLYQLLKSNHQLKKYLPHTILLDSQASLEPFFEQHKDVYINRECRRKGKIFIDCMWKMNI